MNINYPTIPFLNLVFAKTKTWFVLPALIVGAITAVSAQPQQTSASASIESQAAVHQVPFKAVFTTQFTGNVVFPIAYIFVTGQGNASHLGKTATSTTNQQGNLITGEGSATYTLIGANGDTVVIEIEALNTNLPGGVTFSGTYTVTGGTGRFAGATGGGSMSGQAVFTSEAGDGVGSFSFMGTISSPGSSQ